MIVLTSISILLLATMSQISSEKPAEQKRNGKSFFHYTAPQSPVSSLARYLNMEIPQNLRNTRFDSPIYYVRLPPIPYSYVPGFGYISQPAPTNTLVNLPINFLANGKPSSIYRWSGAYDPIAAEPVPTKPMPIPDSPIHRLQGNFPFSGKVSDLYLLKDPYNPFIEDSFQSIYP